MARRSPAKVGADLRAAQRLPRPARNSTRAREYLQQAFALDPHYRQVALEDTDPEPLWRELSS
ncbi:MAG: hypothetical protein JXB04_01550 [Kiritimatiellae bacterium]|nr:hypothetical protein [Kiritimatiellia bacterium]